MGAARARRPWKVFVQEIGPTFTFADPAAAHERARALTDGTLDTYGRVEVYCSDPKQADILERWHYEFGKPPAHQTFEIEPPRWVTLDDFARKAG